MNEENNDKINMETIIITIIIIIGVIILANHFLIQENNNSTEGIILSKWYMTDDTENLGPQHQGLVTVTHDDWTQENTTVSPGDELMWTGAIQWAGPANEGLSAYNKSEIGVHLILTRISEKKVNLILLLGDYTKEMGLPQPPGGKYIDHDSEIIQELGGEEVSDTQAENVTLTVTYDENSMPQITN